VNKTAVLTLGIGRLLQIAIVFLTYRAVTEVLPQDEVGFFFLLQALAGFFGLIVVNPVGTFLNREIHGWEKSGSLRPGLKAFLGFSWVAAIIAGLLIAALSLLGIGSLGAHEPWALTAFTSLVMVSGATIANTFIPLLNILERRLSFVVLTVVSQALALGFSYVVVLRSGAHASNWMLATGAVQIAFGLFAFGLLVRKSAGANGPSAIADHASLSSAKMKELTVPLWSFAAPIAIANFAVWGLMQGYRPLVENFAGLGALSIIGLGLGLASSITASFEALVHQVFLPVFYRRSHSEDLKTRERNWNHLWRACVPSYFGLVVVLMGLSHHFVDVLTGGSYPQAGLYLAIGVGAEFLRMIGNLVVLYAQSERNMKPTRLPYYIGAAVAFAGSLYAIHIGELQYVAYSLIFGQGAAAAFLIKTVITSKEMLKLNILSMIRFLVVPSVLVYLAKDVPAPQALGGVALGMGILTIHYWWQVREK
jgi:O-antigen/teichoic acid export membrane protein